MTSKWMIDALESGYHERQDEGICALTMVSYTSIVDVGSVIL